MQGAVANVRIERGCGGNPDLLETGMNLDALTGDGDCLFCPQGADKRREQGSLEEIGRVYALESRELCCDTGGGRFQLPGVDLRGRAQQ